MAKISDFTKQQIQDCYNEMYDYINDFEMPEDGEDENFSYMRDEIEKRQISIPEDIYVEMEKFIDKELAPLSNGEAFKGMMDAIKKDSEESEIGAQYLWALIQRKKALTEFGKRVLYPAMMN